MNVGLGGYLAGHPHQSLYWADGGAVEGETVEEWFCGG